MRCLTTLLCLTLLVGAGDLVAQQHRHRGDSTRSGMMGRGQGMMGQGEGMMHGMAIRAFDPEHLLEMRADLGLTGEQITRIETIQTDTKKAHDAAMASHDRYREQMMEALAAEVPDPTRVRGLMAGAHESMGQAHWAEMQAALEAMAVLTDTQRAQVRKPQPAGMQHHRGQERH